LARFAACLAIRTLATTTDADARLGAVILLAVAVNYVVGGLAGILVGHDILDAMLTAFLAVGSYLAAGTSMLPEEAADPQRPGIPR
jgi:O-antigen ligase